MEIFNGLVTEAGIYADLPPGDYYAVQALTTIVADGGSATLTVTDYGSDDGGVVFNNAANPISAVSIATRTLNSHGGGYAVAANPWYLGHTRKVRLVTSTSTVAHVRLLVTLRFKKRHPLMLAARAQQEEAARAASERAEGGCGCAGKCGGGPTVPQFPGGSLDLTPGLPDGAVFKSFACGDNGQAIQQRVPGKIPGDCFSCLYADAVYYSNAGAICWCQNGMPNGNVVGYDKCIDDLWKAQALTNCWTSGYCKYGPNFNPAKATSCTEKFIACTAKYGGNNPVGCQTQLKTCIGLAPMPKWWMV